MAEVFIALGSNLADRQANLERAQAALAPAVTILERSGIHETRPQYVTDQPAFLNMVVRGTTDLAPKALLAFLQRLEQTLGRRPSRRFAAISDIGSNTKSRSAMRGCGKTSSVSLTIWSS